MSNFLKKYKHGFVIIIYCLCYLIAFRYLETRPVRSFHVVHTVFDDMIPFCEYFIVPYLLWFPYIIAAMVYFVFFNKNKHEYYQLTFNLMLGMTLFLIVSYVYPNIQHLRPTEFARDNMFTDMVRALYKTDTPTNILPSIHVFNSLAVHMSLTSCETLRNKKWIHRSSLLLTSLIVLSTMFLKQHSVIDVCLGTTLALFGYIVFYPERLQKMSQTSAPARVQKRHRKHFEI